MWTVKADRIIQDPLENRCRWSIAISCNIMQYHAISINIMQYHAISCNIMQYQLSNPCSMFIVPNFPDLHNASHRAHGKSNQASPSACTNSRPLQPRSRDNVILAGRLAVCPGTSICQILPWQIGGRLEKRGQSFPSPTLAYSHFWKA